MSFNNIALSRRSKNCNLYKIELPLFLIRHTYDRNTHTTSLYHPSPRFFTGRGHWAVYYTSQQPWGLLLNFYWLVHLVECLNVLTTNCNQQKGQFCVSSLGMYIIYQPLSYPFRSLFSTPTCDILICIIEKKVSRGAYWSWNSNQHWFIIYPILHVFSLTFFYTFYPYPFFPILSFSIRP